jgi:hypothetical protein
LPLWRFSVLSILGVSKCSGGITRNISDYHLSKIKNGHLKQQNEHIIPMT